MTVCQHREMLNLTGAQGRVFVDPTQIAAIRPADRDDDLAFANAVILVATDCVYVAETPEMVMVLRSHILGQPVEDPHDCKFLPMQRSAETGTVNGGTS